MAHASTRSSINNRIKAVLAEKSVSNKELAEKLGVSEGTASTWCRNFKQPKIGTLYEIAKISKIDARNLLVVFVNDVNWI